MEASEIVGIALTVGLLLIALIRTQLGVFGWMLAGGLVTVPVYTLRNASIRVSAAVLTGLIILCGIQQLARRRLPRVDSALVAPLCTLVIVTALSFVQGIVFYDANVAGTHRQVAAEVYAATLYVLSVAASFVVATQVDSVVALRKSAWMVISAGLVALLLKDVLPIPWWPLLVTHATALIYARLLFDPPRTFWLQALSCGCVIFVLMEVILEPLLGASTSQWLSGWVMLGVMLASITALRLGWWVWLIAPPAAGAAFVALHAQLRRMVDIAQSEGDFQRLDLWRDALRVMKRRPILGVGPGNYYDYVLTYGNNPFTSAHGNYQQMLAEIGVVGFAVVLWLLWRCTRVAWLLHRNAADPRLDASVVAVTGGVSGVVVASVLGDYLIPAYHNGGHTTITTTLYTWIMVGLLMSVERLVRQQARTKPSAQSKAVETSTN